MILERIFLSRIRTNREREVQEVLEPYQGKKKEERKKKVSQTFSAPPGHLMAS